ncbi:MAG: hypothetical protein HKN72_09830 [Gemmatimonadetes bacterium]|nr:hypothetical protein [Gemmatimonadota bacterium]NNL29694.1 hypothetical protein [Gemmatimonadota bacterium]
MSGQSKWSEKANAAQRARPGALLKGLVGLVIALGFGCGTSQSDSAPARRAKVLLIGIDGVRPDVLAEVQTPNLDALIAAGAYTAGTTTTTPSVSGPAWSSMLTGVWPEKHGVLSNDFTAPRYDEYPDFLSHLEDVRSELTTVAVADWLPIMELDGRRALVGPSIDVREALDGYELGWAEADRRGVDFAVSQLQGADPDATFVYLGNPDEASHEAGSIGEEYREAIAMADAEVGRLVRAVQGRGTLESEDWLILVSTDHGRRADGGHGGDSPEEMTGFILVSGPSADDVIEGPTYIVDVAVTALAHLGIDPPAAWGLDGRAVGLRRSPGG